MHFICSDFNNAKFLSVEHLHYLFMGFSPRLGYEEYREKCTAKIHQCIKYDPTGKSNIFFYLWEDLGQNEINNHSQSKAEWKKVALDLKINTKSRCIR